MEQYFIFHSYYHSDILNRIYSIYLMLPPKPWTGREISGRLGGEVQFNARQL